MNPHPYLGAFEWAGIFEMEHADHTWIAQKVDGAYADATMTFVALEADSCDEAGLEGKEADGEAALTGDCADLTNGGTIEIGTCYTLIFDQDVDTSTWTIEVDHRRRRLEDHDHSCVAMYTQHVPIEFEEDTHYLQLDGEDVEPIAEEGADGHAHDHGGGEAYEWAGTFELEHGESYTWIAQKVDGDYADETMTIVAMEVAGGTQADLELVVDEAAALLEGDCEDVAFGGSIGFGACYKLVFQQDISTSLYYVPVPAERRLEDHDGHDHGDADMGYFAFFTQHVPVEFEDTMHYLKDDHGEDIEPAAELGGGGDEDDDDDNTVNERTWRNTMLGTFIVLLCTFVGILGRLPFKNIQALRTDTIIAYSSALAVGAILGCAAFLMMVESSHYIMARWAEETQMTWRFGTMLLAGYSVGMILNVAFPHTSGGAGGWFAGGGGSSEKSAELVSKDAVAAEEVGLESEYGKSVDYAFCFNIFFGDFLHNFVDGIFIAGAFMDCTTDRGWIVTAATIYHELVQEFADFFLLIGPGGLSVVMACVVNFMSGISVMIGGAIYLATEPGSGTKGLMLAFSAGVYLYVACTEAAVHAVHNAHKFSAAQRVLLFLFFVTGAVGIGLVLLDHEHCTPKGDSGDGDDPHAGHNH